MNVLTHTHNVKDLNKFILHKSQFQTTLKNSIYHDNYEPFLFQTEPNKMDGYYREEKEMEQSEIM